MRIQNVTAAALLLCAAHANAQTNGPVQVLDDHTVSCIDQSFDMLDMPGARTKVTGYGEITREKRISDEFTASVILDTDVYRYSTHASFSANVYQHQDNQYDYRHRASITLYFNNDNRLTNITRSPVNSGWVYEDMYYSPSEAPPPLSETNKETIDRWIMQTIEAAAFMMSYCQSDGADIYTPENGEAVGPPEFLTLDNLEEITP
ncbi:MAG: hypothetical protein ACLFR0_03225 [Alphaproteobacteria bacterium]